MSFNVNVRCDVIVRSTWMSSVTSKDVQYNVNVQVWGWCWYPTRQTTVTLWCSVKNDSLFIRVRVPGSHQHIVRYHSIRYDCMILVLPSWMSREGWTLSLHCSADDCRSDIHLANTTNRACDGQFVAYLFVRGFWSPLKQASGFFCWPRTGLHSEGLKPGFRLGYTDP